MHILIVDDSAVIRDTLDEFLKPYGTRDHAKDGLEALDLIATSIIENNRYDIIFTDITMPRLSGLALLKKLRRLESDHKLDEHKVVLISASFSEKTYMEWMANYCSA